MFYYVFVGLFSCALSAGNAVPSLPSISLPSRDCCLSWCDPSLWITQRWFSTMIGHILLVPFFIYFFIFLTYSFSPLEFTTEPIAQPHSVFGTLKTPAHLLGHVSSRRAISLPDGMLCIMVLVVWNNASHMSTDRCTSILGQWRRPSGVHIKRTVTPGSRCYSVGWSFFLTSLSKGNSILWQL